MQNSPVRATNKRRIPDLLVGDFVFGVSVESETFISERKNKTLLKAGICLFQHETEGKQRS